MCIVYMNYADKLAYKQMVSCIYLPLLDNNFNKSLKGECKVKAAEPLFIATQLLLVTVSTLKPLMQRLTLRAGYNNYKQLLYDKKP